MPSARTRLGLHGEDLAARYVTDFHGYVVRERNYHCRYGEIDLVCLDGRVLVFCEVKLRRSTAFGEPEDALTPAKIGRLVRSAQTYVAAHGLDEVDWRLDLVAIVLDGHGQAARLTLYRGVGGD